MSVLLLLSVSFTRMDGELRACLDPHGKSLGHTYFVVKRGKVNSQ
ncbi:hypothetical protein GLYMA_05G113450v4 [Glycine max]|nr:hypothetical protein GLYMA_05G113450v4 [Glycine max]KAH1133877.1 hypothetical protein GYH30_012332 [Glycine max]